MQRDTEDRWKELCRQVSVETDTDRILELVREINRIFDASRTPLESSPEKPADKPLRHR